MAKKIMIIDDEPDIRIYLAAAAEDHGFEPVTFGAEESIITIIGDEKPDLIVMDIMMPMRSGVSIFKEIRSSPSIKHVPVILISGMDGLSDFMENEFHELINDDSMPPPDGFIEKPVDLDILFQKIKNLLDHAK